MNGRTIRTDAQIGDDLLFKLLDYLTARRAFEIAVDNARRAGWRDEQIGGITGLSPSRIDPLVSLRRSPRPNEPHGLDGPVAA